MKFSLRKKFFISYIFIIVTILILLNTYGYSLMYNKIAK